MSRLSIELTEQQHQQIKARAALQGQSIKDYTLSRLFPMSADEEKAMADLQALILPRIKAALLGEVSDQSFEEIVDEGLREGHPS
jgi:uncharacterized protein (DUF1778 family)